MVDLHGWFSEQHVIPGDEDSEKPNCTDDDLP
jgi:endogenous inhibitor of DNA gyrase (YacG/DUF329 family)